MRGLVAIHSCPHGIVHLTIGAVTIRVEQEAFQHIAEEVEKKAKELNQARVRARLELKKGGVS